MAADGERDPLRARLASLDACAVSDALDQAKLNGVALGLSCQSAGRRIAGRAITVRLGPDDGRASKRHLGTAAVEAGGPGSIIVIAHSGRMDVAGWGGILSMGAVTRGIEGVVIDGVCRDLDESRELGLPVYGRGGVPRTARGRIIELDWNMPVEICGVTVRPNDLVIADASGVVFIPQDSGEAIIAAAEAIVAKEKAMADAVGRGTPISKVMSGDYESMLRGDRS